MALYLCISCFSLVCSLDLSFDLMTSKLVRTLHAKLATFLTISSFVELLVLELGAIVLHPTPRPMNRQNGVLCVMRPPRGDLIKYKHKNLNPKI